MHYIIEEVDEDTSMEDLQKMMVVALIYRLLVCFYEVCFDYVLICGFLVHLSFNANSKELVVVHCCDFMDATTPLRYTPPPALY